MILVTGATGFVGGALVCRLVADMPTRRLVVAVRKADLVWPEQVSVSLVGDLLADTDWSAALKGVQEVVHSAARVHVMSDKSADPLAEFRRVNVAGTLNLARQAAAAGVRRFVFVSSVKVNGEATLPGQVFTELDAPAPQDPYSSVVDKELFSRVGFYRDDIKALSLQGDNVLATNSLLELLKFKPALVVGYFFSKSILAAFFGRVIGARVVLTGGADQISPALLSGYRLLVRRAAALLALLLAHRVFLSCTDDVVNFRKLCFGIRALQNKIELVNHVVVPTPLSRSLRVPAMAKSSMKLCSAAKKWLPLKIWAVITACHLICAT